MIKNKKIDWFWAHRRNSSLNHLSFIMHGLNGRGWSPVVNFYFNNQIVIGVPDKGCYIFYDKNQLKSGKKFKDIQKSIDNNLNFPKDFNQRTNELFGALFFKCIEIDTANLKLLTDKELFKLYKEFIDAMLIAPIITVQLWGIEACFDENYKIIKFLEKRLVDLGKAKDFQYYKEMLSVNIGETVAFAEQKNFYQVASAIDKPVIRKVFKGKSLKTITKNLKKYKKENELIEKHIKKYEWVNSEYVSGAWKKEKWVELFKKAFILDKRPQENLEELLDNFNNLNNKKKEIIKELKPTKDVLHAIRSLEELIAQRDWAKGYLTKSLISYHKLIDEIARRTKLTREDLFNFSYTEIIDYFKGNKKLEKKEPENRKKNGFALIIKNGKLSMVSGERNIQKVIREEKISDPFEKIVSKSFFKGLSASRGVTSGKVRVLEDSSKIPEFKDGEIIVTYMTTMEFTPIFRKAKAVVTDEGGMSCHAAIISREFKIPCIVGSKVATRVLKTGDLVEVDANNGIIKILNK
jgi:phosphohistidine swiveling domain-containing protein